MCEVTIVGLQDGLQILREEIIGGHLAGLVELVSDSGILVVAPQPRIGAKVDVVEVELALDEITA